MNPCHVIALGGQHCPICIGEMLERVQPPGSIRGALEQIDREVSRTVDCVRPPWVQSRTLKRILAFRWLERPQPRGFWARVSWAVRLIYATPRGES